MPSGGMSHGDSVYECSHPFPPHWHVSSRDNYTCMELTPGKEFDNVQRQFHASLPREAAELLSVTRCEVVQCFARVVPHALCSAFPCTHVASVACTRVQNRYQWQRHQQRRDRMVMMMAASDKSSARDEAALQQQLLWHGTSKTNPETMCMGQDGVDFRLVRFIR